MSNQYAGSAPDVETHANWLRFAHKLSPKAVEAAGELGLAIDKEDVGAPFLTTEGGFLDARQAAYAVLEAQFCIAQLDGEGHAVATKFEKLTDDLKKQGFHDYGIGLVLVVAEDYCVPAMVRVKKWTQIEVLSRPAAKFDAVSKMALTKDLNDLEPPYRVVNEFRVLPQSGKFTYAKVSSVSMCANESQAEKIREFLATGSPGLEECRDTFAAKLEELRGLSA